MRMNAKTHKLLMTIRAALLMAAKAIEEYCKDAPGEVVEGGNETRTG